MTRGCFCCYLQTINSQRSWPKSSRCDDIIAKAICQSINDFRGPRWSSGSFPIFAIYANVVLGSVQSAPGLARLSERDERFENLGDAVPAHANKPAGDLLGPSGGSVGGRGSADGLELLRQLLWPGLSPHLRGGINASTVRSRASSSSSRMCALSAMTAS